MSIQGLLQKGAQDCSFLEKVADKILFIPCAMWKGKQINAIISGEQISFIDKPAKSYINYLKTLDEVHFNPEQNASCQPLQPLPECAFGISSFFVSPLLALGLAVKTIALLSDRKARAYHKIMEKCLSKSKLDGRLRFLNQDKKIREGALNLYNTQINSILTPLDPKSKKIVEQNLLNPLLQRKEQLLHDIHGIDQQQMKAINLKEAAERKVLKAIEAYKKAVENS